MTASSPESAEQLLHALDQQKEETKKMIKGS